MTLWQGLPPAFENAAGLSTQMKNWIDGQADPAVRDQTREERDEAAKRLQEQGIPLPISKNSRRGSALHSDNSVFIGSDELAALRNGSTGEGRRARYPS